MYLKYFFLITTILIAITSNNLIGSNQNKNVQLIEYSFLNAQAPESNIQLGYKLFSLQLEKALFPGRGTGETCSQFLSKYGFFGNPGDLKDECSKKRLDRLTRALKSMLSDFYYLAGKNQFFKGIDQLSSRSNLAEIDITNFAQNTYPLLTKTESELVKLLNELFTCLLSMKVTKHQSGIGGGKLTASKLYLKTTKSLSKMLIKLLKDLINNFEGNYRKCLGKTSQTETIECMSVAESLKLCNNHLTMQKIVKKGKQTHEKRPLRGILKSPGSSGEQSPSRVQTKNVKFNDLVTVFD